MLRDNLAGLIEPMRAARELNPLALFTEQKKSSDDRPQDALKIPAPKGLNLTLSENAASPFHAEPRQMYADIQKVDWRPNFELEHSDHPLAQDHHRGITAERVKKIMMGRLRESQSLALVGPLIDI